MGSAVAYWVRGEVNSLAEHAQRGARSFGNPHHGSFTMRMRTGLAGIGIVLGCVSVAACSQNDPTAVRVGAERNYSDERRPDASTPPTDSTTQRGVGGFGSGN
jgi:hypothetical protein